MRDSEYFWDSVWTQWVYTEVEVVWQYLVLRIFIERFSRIYSGALYTVHLYSYTVYNVWGIFHHATPLPQCNVLFVLCTSYVSFSPTEQFLFLSLLIPTLSFSPLYLSFCLPPFPSSSFSPLSLLQLSLPLPFPLGGIWSSVKETLPSTQLNWFQNIREIGGGGEMGSEGGTYLRNSPPCL